MAKKKLISKRKRIYGRSGRRVSSRASTQPNSPAKSTRFRKPMFRRRIRKLSRKTKSLYATRRNASRLRRSLPSNAKVKILQSRKRINYSKRIKRVRKGKGGKYEKKFIIPIRSSYVQDPLEMTNETFFNSRNFSIDEFLTLDAFEQLRSHRGIIAKMYEEVPDRIYENADVVGSMNKYHAKLALTTEKMITEVIDPLDLAPAQQIVFKGKLYLSTGVQGALHFFCNLNRSNFSSVFDDILMGIPTFVCEPADPNNSLQVSVTSLYTLLKFADCNNNGFTNGTVDIARASDYSIRLLGNYVSMNLFWKKFFSVLMGKQSFANCMPALFMFRRRPAPQYNNVEDYVYEFVNIDDSLYEPDGNEKLLKMENLSALLYRRFLALYPEGQIKQNLIAAYVNAAGFALNEDGALRMVYNYRTRQSDIAYIQNAYPFSDQLLLQANSRDFMFPLKRLTMYLNNEEINSLCGVFSQMIRLFVEVIARNLPDDSSKDRTILGCFAYHYLNPSAGIARNIFMDYEEAMNNGFISIKSITGGVKHTYTGGKGDGIVIVCTKPGVSINCDLVLSVHHESVRHAVRRKQIHPDLLESRNLMFTQRAKEFFEKQGFVGNVNSQYMLKV